MRGQCIKMVVIPKHFVLHIFFQPIELKLKSGLQFHLDCFILILFWWHTEAKL